MSTALIVSNLDVLRKKEQQSGNVFKARAYAKAITSLTAHKGVIVGVDDVDGIPGIGKKIKEKIGEILATGHLAAADAARHEPVYNATDVMMAIYGVGPVKARELVKRGLKSIEDVRAAFAADPSVLNAKQAIGLRYYEDLLPRIPRAEMAQHETALVAAFRSADPNFRVDIVGSYRRGAATSGDVDALVSLPASISKAAATRAFAAAVSALKADYMLEALAEGPKKFMGIARLPRGRARRVDILLTPLAEYPFAVLYFTGSDTFNIAMRKRALERGWSLNEHGFTPLPATNGVLPPISTEKDIFDFLDMPYVAPTARNMPS